ncbi:MULTISPECIES: hypothetical protein [Pedobacter]|uniref:Uncharacterized protein n=1 Tax=Pedobacter zeae TaxID=1737356 RepID=A0A7W6P487_9SPHI|nr:hypothetical protein [Pedobacter zeae]MBB4106538.1 hypothetical protein [Pedobacter zeae]MBO9672026.1 hypothetical protein [Sphingobacteriaceae bacterium]GGH02299.1 hypothetical protein GCM10007422_16630 [Pedobacter zeae]
MRKHGELDGIIHTNSSGKLYIKSPDFFAQPRIIQMVSSLMESSIFKKIEKDKNKK